MARSIISTDGAPAAIGPYAQGVRVGNLIFTAGQGGLDPVTGQVVSGGIKEQTERTIQNLKAVLESGGSSLGQVVKATVFLKDMNDFVAMNAVYASFFENDSDTLPARTTVEVARLPAQPARRNRSRCRSLIAGRRSCVVKGHDFSRAASAAK